MLCFFEIPKEVQKILDFLDLDSFGKVIIDGYEICHISSRLNPYLCQEID
jgi:hypothetical protein